MNRYYLKAEELREQFSKFGKCEIVGSIRRGVKKPGDIDLLFTGGSLKRKLLKKAIKKLDPGYDFLHEDNSYYRFFVDKIKVEVMLTSRQYWGANKLKYTGPKEFSRQIDFHENKDDGYVMKEVPKFKNMSEKQILTRLNLRDFEDPKARENWKALRKLGAV